MRRCFLLFGTLFACLNLCAQEDTAMAAILKHMTPGEAHELLASRVGHWQAEITTLAEPDGETSVTQGTAIIDMVLGGRFLKTTLTAKMEEIPFTGVSYEGYDNTRKIFTLIWMDTSATSMTYGEGSYNQKENAVYMLGAMLDPVSGEDMKYQCVTRLEGKDKMIFSLFSEADGQEFEAIHIVYTRKH